MKFDGPSRLNRPVSLLLAKLYQDTMVDTPLVYWNTHVHVQLKTVPLQRSRYNSLRIGGLAY